jgi:hypothetical protein
VNRLSATGRGLVDDLRAVALPWLTARALVLVGYCAAFAISDRLTPGARPNQLTEGLIAWDGTWYREIAARGYSALPDEALRFFPLFPLSGRGLSFLTFGREDAALILLANVASIVMLVMVRRLVRLERGSAELSDRAVWMVCLFPGAFVLAWGYAEALFLLFAVTVFWAIRSRRWGWAIIAGLCVGATRPLGVLIVLPVAIEMVRVWRSARSHERSLAVGALLAPVAGIGAYLVWVAANFGDGWLPFSVQGPLRGSSDPFTRLWRGLGDLFGPERLADGLHIPVVLVFLVLVVLSFRWWPASYGAFAAVMVGVALSADNLNSLERYGLNAFPLALTLAVAAHRPSVERVTTTVLAGAMVAMCAMAWTGTYVP